MFENLSVSASTLAKGRRLGIEMTHDPLIRPYLVKVAQYQSYHRFRIAHRAHWEQSSHFEHCYQERLFDLADRETRRNGMSQCDSVVNWDLWHHHIVRPISTALWEAWETEVHLEGRYFEALLSSREAKAMQFCSVVQGESDAAEVSVPSRLVLPPQEGAVSSLFKFLRYGVARLADA